MEITEIKNKLKEIYELDNPQKIKHIKYNDELSSFLKDLYNDSISLSESLYRFINNIKEKPKCKYCHNNYVKFLSLTRGYRDYCSIKCMSNSKDVKNKIVNTCLEKYGVRNGGGSKEALQKIKETNMNKRGVTCPLKDPIVQAKIKQTNIIRYGVDNPNKCQKIKEKTKQTCLRKYGATSFLISDYCNKIRNNKYIQDKIQHTKIKHKTFNTSKPEEELYLYIKEKFPSVIRQYKDKERYPFNCDFYIPELDLFLELNGTWTHGKHPYDPNSIDDNKIVSKMELKNTKYYKIALKVWTVSDPKKRQYAKVNNLNFKEVWTLQEGKDFIDSL